MDNKTVINPAVANTPATVINNEVVAEYNRQNQIDIDTTTMLSAGTVVCDRYKIQNQLEVSSGEADLYLCSDGQRQFVAKIYKRKFAVKQEVSDALRKIDSPYVAKLYPTLHRRPQGRRHPDRRNQNRHRREKHSPAAQYRRPAAQA